MSKMAGTFRTITKAIAKPGQEEALKSLMEDVAQLACQEEGCLGYELWQGHPNRGEFVGIGEWTDEAAFYRYEKSTSMDEFMREIPELVNHPPDTQWYVDVSRQP
jgi:quinol monooxygenase YgiN